MCERLTRVPIASPLEILRQEVIVILRSPAPYASKITSVPSPNTQNIAIWFISLIPLASNHHHPDLSTDQCSSSFILHTRLGRWLTWMIEFPSTPPSSETLIGKLWDLKCDNNFPPKGKHITVGSFSGNSTNYL